MAQEGETPALSVVIPCLNAAETIGVQLEALSAQEWSRPWEVVVADNGSSDGSTAVVERFRGRLPHLRIVDAARKRGAAYASNLGVRHARGASIAFCDADDEVGAGWLAAVGEALTRHELVACRGEAERLNEPWLQESRVVEPDRLSTSWFPPYVPIAGAGGIGVRRELHLRHGGFDEGLLGLYDVEYCIRLALAGHELVFLPDAVVHMRYRTRWAEIFGQARHYAHYGAALQRRFKPAEARFPGRLKWVVSGGRPLLQTLPKIRHRSARAKLAWLLGWQVGRYSGSVRFRVLAV
ncbi:MAG: glycosyltransferase family 2 protein [Actinomycetota bacterium]|nr:glycosyltransferase family 2 protein [Actinomycetota bacterium]